MSTKENFAPIQSTLMTADLKYFQDTKADSIRADFSFQSRVRWTIENKRSYMTSLVLGMAPSKFILADTKLCGSATRKENDKNYYDGWLKQGVRYINVDSNNRVTTIAAYYDNEFGLEKGFYDVDNSIVEIIEGENDTYDKLPDSVREKLNNALITIELVTTASREQLSRLFIRLNDGMSLNGPEKRNAVICDFANEVRRLATKYQSDLSCFFSPKDIHRRKVDDFIAGLAMIYFHGIGVTISDKTLWSAYKSESNEDIGVKKFVDFLEKFFKFLGTNLSVIPNKNTVLDLFFMYKQLTDNRYVVEDSEGFFKDFFKTNAKLLVDPEKHQYNEGRDATYKELLRSREVRFNNLRYSLIIAKGEFDPIKYAVKRDSRRGFSREEKFIAAVNQDFVTPEGKEIDPTKLYDWQEYQGGHIEPWSDGGETNQENCVIQTAEDNRELGANPVE
tara:strand:+ start:177 stop:1520 length:1344 start_codon:yes stop_codon:yes gene_type:complete